MLCIFALMTRCLLDRGVGSFRGLLGSNVPFRTSSCTSLKVWRMNSASPTGTGLSKPFSLLPPNSCHVAYRKIPSYHCRNDDGFPDPAPRRDGGASGLRQVISIRLFHLFDHAEVAQPSKPPRQLSGREHSEFRDQIAPAY